MKDNNATSTKESNQRFVPIASVKLVNFKGIIDTFHGSIMEAGPDIDHSFNAASTGLMEVVLASIEVHVDFHGYGTTCHEGLATPSKPFVKT